MKNLYQIKDLRNFGTAAILLAFAGSSLGATYGHGPNPYAPPAHMSLREQAATKPIGLTFDVVTGMGRYQDIQAPLASAIETPDGLEITRVDGSKTLVDSTTHYGPLLSGRIGWSGDNEFGRQFAGISGMRMSALSSNDPNAAGSSYARLSADGGADWIVGDHLSVLSGVELRRSMYRNTDSGHYIDSIILRTGVDQGIGNYALGATLGVAPITQFGYMQRSSSGSSGGLRATSSSLYEWGLTAAWKPVRDATLFLGLSQEVVSADMSNVGAYKSLGLNVAEQLSDSTDRHYRLSTTSLTLGASRRL